MNSCWEVPSLTTHVALGNDPCSYLNRIGPEKRDFRKLGIGEKPHSENATYQDLARYELADIHDSPREFKVIQFAIRSASNATLSA
jgi:hypothetical protein